jgi:hypothetical protein
MKLLFTAFLATSLVGCAFHQTPYVAYDGQAPRSDTSVFSVVTDNAATKGALEITHVDGRPTSCFQVGCPVWVRVLPGEHSFTLVYKGDFKLLYPQITWRTAGLKIDVTDMQSRHVYFGEPAVVGDRLHVDVVDLGEKPKHGISLGLEGVNRKYYPVEF